MRAAQHAHRATRSQTPTEQDAAELRAELDELLRARQYASQRERRLSEAVRQSADGPDEGLLRQLAQARTLREGLSTRCVELDEQLRAVEERLRSLIPSQPAGARFAGAAFGQPAHAEWTEPAPAPPATGARFGGVRHPEPQPQPQPQPERPQQPQQPPAGRAPRPRSTAELTALADRLAALAQQGATAESATLLTQATTLLAPPDVARLAGLLARRGPAGAAGALARAAAQATPLQAAQILAQLRRAELAAEANELFHALWSYPVAALPALLAALEAAGQPADGATLLWEWGSASTPELAALATALHTAGRPEDARTLLRQAAGRSAAALAELAGLLPAPLAAVLLHELPALRPPTELVRLAEALRDRRELYDALLAPLLADQVRHRTALAAFRSAELPVTPAGPQRSRWGRRHQQ